MNALQVKTINLTPAVVEFNFDELSAVLDGNLKKYEGLTFTDKDAAACKKTIAELNKGKKALNDYRLATKKELTVSVTDFEDKCKELSAKFDQVIVPLKDQADQFEEDRREEKRDKIQAVIDKLIEKEGLSEKFAAQLIIEDKHLNKSVTLKSITEELAIAAEHLGIKQDKEEANVEIIKSHVELINERHSLNLIDSAYINLLDFQSIDAIKDRIELDAEGAMERLAPKEVVFVEKLTPKFDELVVPVDKNEESFREVYKVTATESQLDALEEYMSSHGINWVSLN